MLPKIWRDIASSTSDAPENMVHQNSTAKSYLLCCRHWYHCPLFAALLHNVPFAIPTLHVLAISYLFLFPQLFIGISLPSRRRPRFRPLHPSLNSKTVFTLPKAASVCILQLLALSLQHHLHLFAAMARQISLIRDITPNTPYPWTTKVLVTEKSAPREARDSPIKYQKYALTDSTGGVVQLTLFDSSINMFKDRLQLFKKYYISNALVKGAVRKYQFGSTAYQWSLHSTSVIDEAEDDDQVVAHEYNFINFDNVIAYKDSPAPIVIALHVLPKKQIRTKNGPMELQEFVVIDRSLKPAIMTLWEPFVKNEASNLASVIDQKPIFAAIRVRVVPYNGITINTKNNSSFLINLTIPPALELRSWLYDNMGAVNELLNSRDLVTNAREFGKEATDALTTVAAVSIQTHLRLFNVKCTLQLTDYNQSFVFMSCNSCNGKTTAAYNAIYTCNFCGKARVISTPRARVEVNVRDSTGNVLATLLGPDAETFLGCTISTLHENLMLPEPEPMETIIGANNKEEVFVQLRAYTVNYLGVPTRRLGAFFIDAPATMVITGDTSALNASNSQTMAQNDRPEAVQVDDPDITPEEKQILDNILNRKKRNHAQHMASAKTSVSVALNDAATQPAIVQRVASSPVSTALYSATARSAIDEHAAPEHIANPVTGEELLPADIISIEGTSADAVAEDNWEELMRGPPATTKTPVKVEPSLEGIRVDATDSDNGNELVNCPPAKKNNQAQPTGPKAKRKLDVN